MAKLDDKVIAAIQEAATKLRYGEIVIHLVDHASTVDIEVNERIRVDKAPRPGQVVTR